MRAPGVAVGVQASARDCGTKVDVDHPDAVSGAFGLVGGEPDRSCGRVAEEHLRHRTVVCGDGVRIPRRGIDRLPGGTGGDGRAGDAGLVLALVGEEGVAGDVAQRVQPAVLQGADHAGDVHLQP